MFQSQTNRIMRRGEGSYRKCDTVGFLGRGVGWSPDSSDRGFKIAEQGTVKSSYGRDIGRDTQPWRYEDGRGRDTAEE